MKRITALLLICALLLPGVALAAEWAEGLGPEQPYPGVPKVDLDERMGYMMVFPRTKKPAAAYCDTLRLFLPREDIALGEGSLRLCDGEGEIAGVVFSDAEHVALRAIEPDELEELTWGGGTCIEVRLPVSLKFGRDWHVEMDAGCFTAAEGGVSNEAITGGSAWIPEVKSDYGVSALGVSAPVPEGEDARIEYRYEAEKGDEIRFDVTLGGQAAIAMIYSKDGSVRFDTLLCNASMTVTGTVQKDEANWKVLFLNRDGQQLDKLEFTR